MSGHKVLVVEDDIDIRESLMGFLEDNGYETVGAVHGQDALQKLGGTGERPCMILLDLMMPVMDGRTFLEQQLQQPALSQIPVLIVSASRDAEQTAKDMHTAGHLAKPLNLKQLLAIVRSHCVPD
jgi:two-component system, OmpR family, response regulator CpxR